MGDKDARECTSLGECDRRFYNIDQSLRDYGSRLGEVETKIVVYNEQIKMINNNLQEIKTSLKELQKAVADLEKRPADLSQKIFIGVLTSIITALLMLGLKLLQ
jgi:chromosome segregation ATPase